MKSPLLLFSLAALPFSAVAAEDRPNFIIIIADDHRQGDLGCYGNEIVQTPHLNKLAKDGVLFENATVTSSHGTASRMTYFLGQYERRHGINANSGTTLTLAAWGHSYPVLLREGGYFTGYLGKNTSPVGAGGTRSGLLPASFDFWNGIHGDLGFYPKERHSALQGTKSNTQSEILYELSEQFLDLCPESKPFCLTISLNLPHGAGISSMAQRSTDDHLYRDAYRDQINTIPLPDNYVPKFKIGTEEQPAKLPDDVLYREFRHPGYAWVDSEGSVRERRIRQYQSITGIDRMVGKIRERLAALEIADNTIIYYTSDHGVLTGEHGLAGKALNYQATLAVPLIVCDPRTEDYAKGHRKKELVQSIDIAPTIIDQAGLNKNSHFQGESFRNMIRAKSGYWRTYAFSENLWSTWFGNPRIESVRGQRWKYIRYFKNDRENWKNIQKPNDVLAFQRSDAQRKIYEDWRTASFGEKAERPVYEELYDLENDPGETTNLIRASEHRRILNSLRDKCTALAEKARGPLDSITTVPLP